MRQLWFLIIGLLLFCAGASGPFGQESRVGRNPESEPPLAVALLVDNSGSVRAYFSKVIEASKGIVENSQSGDKIFIVRFVSRDAIRIVQDFTTEKSTLIRALDEMYVEGGLSAITDAVYVSTQRLVKDSEEYGSGYKRAVILITDGAEENSFYRTGQVLLLLREKKIPVYALGFPQALGRQGVKVQERARKYLIKLADESGGRVCFVDAPTDVRSVANSILNDIRAH